MLYLIFRAPSTFQGTCVFPRHWACSLGEGNVTSQRKTSWSGWGVPLQWPRKLMQVKAEFLTWLYPLDYSTSWDSPTLLGSSCSKPNKFYLNMGVSQHKRQNLCLKADILGSDLHPAIGWWRTCIKSFSSKGLSSLNMGRCGTWIPLRTVKRSLRLDILGTWERQHSLWLASSIK